MPTLWYYVLILVNGKYDYKVKNNNTPTRFLIFRFAKKCTYYMHCFQNMQLFFFYTYIIKETS